MFVGFIELSTGKSHEYLQARNEPLAATIKKYLADIGEEAASLQLFLNGRVVRRTDTPTSLNYRYDDGDYIFCHPFVVSMLWRALQVHAHAEDV